MIGTHLIENTKLLSSGSPLASFTAWHSRQGCSRYPQLPQGQEPQEPPEIEFSVNFVYDNIWKLTWNVIRLSCFLSCLLVDQVLLHALEDDQLGLPQIDLLLGLMGLKQTNMIKSGLFCFILDAPTGLLVVASTSFRQTSRLCNSVPLDPLEVQRF